MRCRLGCARSDDCLHEQERESRSNPPAGCERLRGIKNGHQGGGRRHPRRLETREVVDINLASREKLATLPGLDDTIADRIIAHRPDSDPQDLVSRHVISRSDYDRIREEIAVKK